MSLLDELSSRRGDRTEYSNRNAAIHLLDHPKELGEIVAGLASDDARLVGDSAEVLTMVAETRPELVAPQARRLVPLLESKNTRVRWETAHALALVAALTPRVVGPLLPRLAALARDDGSVIVRDYAVQAIANYAGTSARGAKEARPHLEQVLTTGSGKQAHHALNGLAKIAGLVPACRDEIAATGHAYVNHPRGVVKKAARALVKACEAESTPRKQKRRTLERAKND